MSTCNFVIYDPRRGAFLALINDGRRVALKNDYGPKAAVEKIHWGAYDDATKFDNKRECARVIERYTDCAAQIQIFAEVV